MSPVKSSVVDVFDSLAAQRTWETLYGGRIDRHSYNFVTRHRAVEELLAPETMGKVLDLGCGTGDLTPYFVARGSQYTGLDISARMIERAAETNRSAVESGKAKFMVGDSERLPWNDNEFDVVSAVGLIEYFPDAGKVVTEMGRVLKRGGVALVTVPHKSCINFQIRGLLAPIRQLLTPAYKKVSRAALSVMNDVKHYHYDPPELDALMATGGFAKKTERFSNFYLIPHPVDHLLPGLYMKLSELVDRSRHSDRFGRFAANYLALYRKA